MTTTKRPWSPRVVYAEVDDGATMRRDGEAAVRRLHLEHGADLDAAAARSREGDASPRPWVDLGREVAGREVDVSVAAARIAGALHLHLD